MSDAGLRVSRQAAVAGDATVALDDSPPSAVWSDLADGLVESFAAAVRDVLAGATPGERVLRLADTCDSDDETVLACASVWTAFDRAPETERYQEAVGLFSGLADAGATPVAVETSLEQVRTAVVPILTAGDQTPTVSVRLAPEFRDRRADHRREVCELLATLSTACDVRVYGSGLDLRWLAQTHHADLPGSVREQCSTGRPDTPVDAAVATARDQLDHDGSAVAVLRALADADSETRTYGQLTAALPISRSAVRNHLGTLRDLGLVSERVTTPDGSAVELRRAGQTYLKTLDREIGRQQSIQDSVRETGNCSHHARVDNGPQAREDTPDSAETAPPTADHTADRSRYHTVTYLSRAEHAGAVGAAPPHGMAVTDYPVGERSGRLDGGWSYSSVRSELVVSAEFVNVLPWRVTLARTLLDRRTFADVLTPERVEDAIGDLLRDHKDMLRGMRCFGYLPNSIDTAEEFIAALREARDDLLEMTRQLYHEDYELDKDAFRTVIIREALGLAGVAVHLLDLVGVDVMIECRVPQYSRHFDAGRQDTLVETLVREAPIFSRYGHHVAERQLFEDRPEKRRQVFEPTIDAADPYGELIPSYSIVGQFGSKQGAFVDELRDALTTPADVHDDAPEFAVAVPVRTDTTRDGTARAAWSVLSGKRLQRTTEVVSVLDAFATTPYDVADALAQLSKESFERECRIDEARFALAHLDADRLLDGAPPTVQATVKALLAADASLSRAELADRAGVSTRSLRTHLPRLLAMDVVQETPEGYRLTLSFHTDTGRRRDVCPRLTTDESYLARDAVYEVLEATDAPPAVFDVWIDLPPDGVPDVDRLTERVEWLSWGLPLLRALSSESRPTDTRTVQFGSPTPQASLTTPTDTTLVTAS